MGLVIVGFCAKKLVVNVLVGASLEVNGRGHYNRYRLQSVVTALPQFYRSDESRRYSAYPLLSGQ